MKPILPLPKHASNGFSIESIIQKDRNDRGCSSPYSRHIPATEDIGVSLLAPTLPDAAAIAGRIPPLHPSLPTHVRNLLLAGENAQLQNHDDILNFQRSAAWAFQNHTLPSISTLSRTLPQHSFAPATYPNIWSAQRESLGALNPWLFSRNVSGFLGFPFGHPDTSIFYHPYRKPKRIRTAFSPSQLLKLEHAFEKNHYVVGQERKDLAVKLNLTETQVKVWFQNRRTKFKRVKTDESSDQESDDQPGGSGYRKHEPLDSNLDQSDSNDDEH